MGGIPKDPKKLILPVATMGGSLAFDAVKSAFTPPDMGSPGGLPDQPELDGISEEERKRSLRGRASTILGATSDTDSNRQYLG